MAIVPVIGDLLFSPTLASGYSVVVSKERMDARNTYLKLLEKDVAATLVDMQSRCKHHFEIDEIDDERVVCAYCGLQKKVDP